jgi:hypothetical protein
MVSLPSYKNIFRCIWVYRNKKVTYIQVSRYKERLITKGFQQIHGIDYDETFATIENMDSIIFSLAIAVNRGWEVHNVSTWKFLWVVSNKTPR